MAPLLGVSLRQRGGPPPPGLVATAVLPMLGDLLDARSLPASVGRASLACRHSLEGWQCAGSHGPRAATPFGLGCHAAPRLTPRGGASRVADCQPRVCGAFRQVAHRNVPLGEGGADAEAVVRAARPLW